MTRWKERLYMFGQWKNRLEKHNNAQTNKMKPLARLTKDEERKRASRKRKKVMNLMQLELLV